jgi:hypothetical protein
MPLISLNPLSLNQILCKYTEISGKYLLIVDNKKYYSLSEEKKQQVFSWYEDNEIIPEAEIDRIFELEVTYYIFETERIAVDNCYDWFPQIQNCPDEDHWIKAYVLTPFGTIPYVNNRPTPLTEPEE